MLDTKTVSIKQAYEWVKTGQWTLMQFTQWLNVRY